MIKSFDAPLYVFDCNFCSKLLVDEAENQLKESAKKHLKSEHFEELSRKFKNNDNLRDCRDCNNSKLDGLVCSECGQDHTQWYLGTYHQLDVYKVPENLQNPK